MALAELYDYFSSSGVTADYVATELQLSPQRVIPQVQGYTQYMHEGDGGADEVVTMATEPVATVTLQWDYLTKSSAGTLLDFYMDTSKAHGKQNTFYWQHPDGHAYTARFIDDMTYIFNVGNVNHGIASLKLKLYGQKP